MWTLETIWNVVWNIGVQSQELFTVVASRYGALLELHDVLSQSSGLVGEDVLDLPELLVQGGGPGLHEGGDNGFNETSFQNKSSEENEDHSWSDSTDNDSGFFFLLFLLRLGTDYTYFSILHFNL